MRYFFPSGSAVKNPPAVQETQRLWFHSWVGKIPWRRKWQLTPVFLLGKANGQRSLTDCGPWGHKESDTTGANEQAGMISRKKFILP